MLHYANLPGLALVCAPYGLLCLHLQLLIPSLRWPIHGNLYVTLMLVFCRRSSTKLLQNYNNTLTNLRQKLVDENPNLAQCVLGGWPPWCVLDSFEFSSTKFCQSCVKVLSKASDKRQALK